MSTVQSAFINFYSVLRESFSVSMQQAKAALDIISCRTDALGGRLSKCEECGYSAVHYNSCRNRHCPLCQGITKDVWVDKRSRDILNAPYFHVVFTVPKQPHTLIYQNQKRLYNLMYKAVSETLFELCRDTRYLGAKPGFFCILHTWGQNLHFHPHIHVVVLAGGLTKHRQWRNSSKKFFIPVKVLSKKFRGKYMYYLKQLYRQNLLEFHGSAKQHQDPKAFQALVDQCYGKDWYTYTKRTFSGPQAVVRYLSGYTHRIAISNTRISSVDEQRVTFFIKDYQSGSKIKTMSLPGALFIRRFLMHVLPKGFVKIRYYGILANRNKKTKLALCRKLTRSPSYTPRFEGLKSLEILRLITGKDVTLCPECQSKLSFYSFCPGSSP